MTEMTATTAMFTKYGNVHQNWKEDATDGKYGSGGDDDNDSFLFVNHNDLNHDQNRILNEEKERDAFKAITLLPLEIVPQSLSSPSKERNSADINKREVNLRKASDNLADITKSSVAGSCPNRNDGHRQSMGTKTQTDILTSPPIKPPPPPNSHATLKMNQGVVKKARKEMEDILLYKMGITKEEIKCALD